MQDAKSWISLTALSDRSFTYKHFCLLVICIKLSLRHWDWVNQAVLTFKVWNNNQESKTRNQRMNFFGTGVLLSPQALSCHLLSGSRFQSRNSEKTAHSSVKYQKCLSGVLFQALITALETVLLCHVACNHLNHATTAAAGHCRKRHLQKMSSATFPRTTCMHCSGTGTPVCQLCLCNSPPDHWKETFLRGIVHGALPRVAANA